MVGLGYFPSLDIGDCAQNSDGSGPIDPGSGQFFVARVRSAIFGLVLGLEIFPKKISIFSIFSILVKTNTLGRGQKVPWSKAGGPLIYCG